MLKDTTPGPSEPSRALGTAPSATAERQLFLAVLVDRLPYNESRYSEALRKRQSPLLKYAADSSI